MDTLYSWRAYRSGGAVTVEHSTGKVACSGLSVDRFGRVLAQRVDGPVGADLLLAVVPERGAEVETVSTGVSDLFFNFEQASGQVLYDAAFNPTAQPGLAEAARSFQFMLRAAGICPPTIDALVRDYCGRV